MPLTRTPTPPNRSTAVSIQHLPWPRVSLASSLTISHRGLTKFADRLENAGLIRREAAGDDGRASTPFSQSTGTRCPPNVAGVYSHASSGSANTVAESFAELSLRRCERLRRAIHRTVRPECLV